MSHGITTFDLAAHQRERIRDLEQRLHGKTKDQQQLVRILARTLQIAAGQECDPLVLLAVLEEIDRYEQADAHIAEVLTDERIERLLDVRAAA